MTNIEHLIDYLSEHVTDVVPRFIMQSEIYKKPETSEDYTLAYQQVKQSKWYRQLVDEQWDNGSWGRFHTMDSKMAVKPRFATTEAALRRAREMGLTKDDPMIAKSIRLMERYLRQEEEWPDSTEVHKDKGKSFLTAFPFLIAANLNLFDPDHPLLKPMRDICVHALQKAFSKGFFDAEAWENENRKGNGPCLHAWMAYPLYLLQNTDCMDEELQRQYLEFIWHYKDGIYYVSSFPPSGKRDMESKGFSMWLSTLEALKGFSLFPVFMKEEAWPHLLYEADRLLNDEVTFSSSYGMQRYAESWRNKTARKTDVILRIARIMARC